MRNEDKLSLFSDLLDMDVTKKKEVKIDSAIPARTARKKAKITKNVPSNMQIVETVEEKPKTLFEYHQMLKQQNGQRVQPPTPVTQVSIEADAEELESIFESDDYNDVEDNEIEVSFATPPSIDSNDSLNRILGKNFVITGTLSRVRREVEALIVQHGGHVQTKVNYNTHYLVLGDNGVNTTKHKDAVRLNIPIISENVLMSYRGN